MISVAMISMNEEKAVGRVISDIRSALSGREQGFVETRSSLRFRCCRPGLNRELVRTPRDQ
jgi:hypothetical protein